MAKANFKQRRREVAARHNPPLIHISDVAELLGNTTTAVYESARRFGLTPHHLPRPFSRGTYFEIAAVEALIRRRIQRASHSY